MTELPQMLSLKEAAAQTGISCSTLRRFCKTGRIKYIVAGKKWLLNANSLADYLNEGEEYGKE